MMLPEPSTIARPVNALACGVDPFIAMPLNRALPKLARGDTAPVRALVGASSIHSADVPCPLYAPEPDADWPDVTSVMEIVQLPGAFCTIDACMTSPGCTVPIVTGGDGNNSYQAE